MELEEKVGLRVRQVSLHSIVLHVGKSDSQKTAEKDATESESGGKTSCLCKTLKIVLCLLFVSLAIVAGTWYHGVWSSCTEPWCAASVPDPVPAPAAEPAQCEESIQNEQTQQPLSEATESDPEHVSEYGQSSGNLASGNAAEEQLGNENNEASKYEEEYYEQHQSNEARQDLTLEPKIEAESLEYEQEIQIQECESCENCQHETWAAKPAPKLVSTGASKVKRSIAGVALLGATTLPVSYGLRSVGIRHEFTNFWGKQESATFVDRDSTITLTLGADDGEGASETISELNSAQEPADLGEASDGDLEANDGDLEASEPELEASELEAVSTAAEIDDEETNTTLPKDMDLDGFEKHLRSEFKYAEPTIVKRGGDKIDLSFEFKDSLWDTSDMSTTFKNPRLVKLKPFWPGKEMVRGGGKDPEPLVFAPWREPKVECEEDAVEALKEILAGVTIDGRPVTLESDDVSDLFILTSTDIDSVRGLILLALLLLFALAMLLCACSFLWCFDRETEEGYQFGPITVYQDNRCYQQICASFMDKQEPTH